MDEFTVPMTPDEYAKSLDAELAAIAERKAQAKKTRSAIALFHELAEMPGVRIGRVQGCDASGRFAADDE